MHPVSEAVLLSWSIPATASLALVLTAVVYLRGWILLWRAGVPFLPPSRATSFLLGLLSLWVALASPCDTFSAFVLTAHMFQHMMLMMVAPPLILLGAPLVPLVRGLPVFGAREFAGPFLRWRVANRIGTWVTNPLVALLLMGGVMFAWHTPRLYELALASSAWHQVEHACFFAASLIFWWPVVQPWPSHAQWPRWAMVPYLLLGDLQNTALSAILVFSDSVIYPSYAVMPRLFRFSAQQDQSAAGAMMWVVGSLAFLIPAVIIAVQCMQLRRADIPVGPAGRRSHVSLERFLTAAQRFSLANRWLKPRLGAAKVEALWFVLLFAITGLSLATLASRSSDDDDQVVRLQQQSGPFAITVFAPPGDTPAGTTTLNVLVQDSHTQAVLTDEAVNVIVRPASGDSRLAPTTANTDDSENKLLQTAELNLPTEGDWTLNLAVQRNTDHAKFSLPLHVVKAESGIANPWPYLTLLAFSALLLATYLLRHGRTRAAGFRQTQAEATHAGSRVDLS
jgi:cytochrome c oxidase assembly factor CtaG